MNFGVNIGFGSVIPTFQTQHLGGTKSIDFKYLCLYCIAITPYFKLLCQNAAAVVQFVFFVLSFSIFSMGSKEKEEKIK